MAAVFLLAAASAVAAAEATPREQALAALRDDDARLRVLACRDLAEIGLQQDLPPLLAALHDPQEPVRRAAEQAVWRIWSRSGDAATDRAFAAGLAQMQQGELRAALDAFSRIIRRQPQFAEGWNKRATIYYLLGEDDLSLKDCDEVLKRNPQHFGVLSGYGQIYVRKGELEKALGYFERALAINPNLGGVRESIEAIEAILREQKARFI